jgi:cytochrome b
MAGPEKSMAIKTGGKVWDGPTRLFHWLLVGLFAYSWWTAKHDQIDRHQVSGIVLLALLVFRLIWGIVGGSTARFSHFVKAPRHVLAYLRGSNALPSPGHNPLGAYSVVALLVLLVIQVVAGLFAVDVDGLESGPLSYLVTFDHGRMASRLHGISFTLLEALIVLHILAVAYYRLRGRDLLLPMVTGRDPHLPQGSAVLQPASLLRLAGAVVIAAALAWWVWKGLPL